MLDRVFDFAIVGSGPSALAAISQIPTGKKVLVVDRGLEIPKEVLDSQEAFRRQISRQDKRSQRVLKSVDKSTWDLKTYWGSDFIYEPREKLPYESRVKGGFSNVWGATCFPPPMKIINQMNDSTKTTFLEALEFIERMIDVSWCGNSADCYPQCATENSYLQEIYYLGKCQGFVGQREFHGSSVSWEPTRLGVSKKVISRDRPSLSECVDCGACQLGCPFGIVWNSWPRFQQEILRLKATYLQGNLDSFTEIEGKVEISITSPSNVSSEYTNRLLLTGGVLSTSEILLRSDRIVEAKIRDSQTAFVYGFSKIRKDSRNRFDNLNFPRVSFLFESTSSSVGLQLYPVSDYILRRGSGVLPVPNFAYQFLKEILQKWMFVGLAYFDSNVSSSIRIRKGELSIIRSKKRIRTRIYKEMRGKLRFLGICLGRFRREMTVGGGYHFMGNFFPGNFWKNERLLIDDGFQKLTELSSFSDLSRVHILDASIQTHMPTGSVTVGVMANVALLTKKIIDIDEQAISVQRKFTNN